MRTRFVFTAEVIKVVRAGLDKKQNELGDGLFFFRYDPQERICKLMTCPASVQAGLQHVVSNLQHVCDCLHTFSKALSHLCSKGSVLCGWECD